ASFFVLPHLLVSSRNDNSHVQGKDACLQGKGDCMPFGSSGPHTYLSDRGKIILWGITILCALVLCSRLSFSTDIRQFDGSDPGVLQAERRFQKIWGGEENPAVLVATGNNLEEALERNEHLYRDAKARIGEDKLCSIAQLLPSKKTREENAKRWVHFWKQGNEEKLRNLLLEHGRKYHFSEDAFSPFFESLYEGVAVRDESKGAGIFSPSLRRVKERFIMKGENGHRVLTFFPDNDNDIAALKTLCDRYPGTFIVSRKNLSHVLSQSVFSEIVYLSAIAALLITGLTFFLLRSIRLTILSFVPVVTGLAVALGIMPVLGLSLNPVNVMAAMIVVGLTSDYGIFMAYACRRALKTGTATAITLSALTTLIGAGVLLFARHPVLFSIGVTMVAGVFSGYISSLTIVPALYPRWIKGTV
ncbi:MAG: hypothetical protein AB1847_21345, partial [bacterium]